MIRILMAGLSLCSLGAACAMAADGTDPEPIAQGWYDWAEPADRPQPPAGARAAFAASGTWTSARCLCAPGFEGRYAADRKTFTVTRAPDAYGDTLHKAFSARQRVCANCAD